MQVHSLVLLTSGHIVVAEVDCLHTVLEPRSSPVRVPPYDQKFVVEIVATSIVLALVFAVQPVDAAVPHSFVVLAVVLAVALAFVVSAAPLALSVVPHTPCSVDPVHSSRTRRFHRVPLS